MSPTRVLLVDDHHLFREGLANILNSQPDFEVVGEAGDGLEAQVKAKKLKPGLILMDVSMPGCDGLEATQRIKQEMPDVTIVMLTVRDEDDKLFQSIRNGAQGYLLKNIRSKDMLEMLRGVVRGEAAITPALGGRMLEEFRRVSKMANHDAQESNETLTLREQEILSLVAVGATNSEIAARLHISIHTVKTHMRKILAKLHQDRRYEAASFALREGLIPPVEDVP
ncbi:MAG: response regulator [Anaerolineales bacterium]|jgi:DNA-binding NarL/FixJ family response regulator